MLVAVTCFSANLVATHDRKRKIGVYVPTRVHGPAQLVVHTSRLVFLEPAFRGVVQRLTHVDSTRRSLDNLVHKPRHRAELAVAIVTHHLLVATGTDQLVDVAHSSKQYVGRAHVHRLQLVQHHPRKGLLV